LTTEQPRGSADAALWDRYAAEWIAGEPQRLWRRHSDAVNIALISDWLPRERLRRILKTDLFDEAVCDGVYAALASRADEVVGLDVAAAVIGAAKKTHPGLKSTAADVRSLPLRTSSFDAIVSLSTLDHFDAEGDIPRALRELYRVLRPGGVLILTLDNLANPVIRLRNALPFGLTHGAGLVPYPVGRTHRPQELDKLVRDAGFMITETSAVMHAPRVLAIPVMNLLAMADKGPLGRALARAAMVFESLRPLPTRFLTGHFIAVRATKPA
jgi:SAM-dependent methyltransferase